jgi:hypothetical protein
MLSKHFGDTPLPACGKIRRWLGTCFLKTELEGLFPMRDEPHRPLLAKISSMMVAPVGATQSRQSF